MCHFDTSLSRKGSIMKPVKLFSLLTLLFIASVGISKADTDWKAKKAQLQKRRPGLTSRVTFVRLEKAFSYARREKYTHAAEVLVELLKQTKNRKDEFAQTWQHLGFILAQKGDTPKAIKALENSLALEALPYQQTLSSLYTLSQLYFSTEKYAEAEAKATEWMNLSEEPTPEGYILLGTILAQNNKKEEALKYVNQAVMSTSNPQEKWLQFALALNHELKQYQNALKILATLTAMFPTNEKYWKQMSSTYLSMDEEVKALSTMELAYKLGHIKAEADLINMVSLYSYLDLSLKGANLLETEMKSGRIQKNAKNLDLLAQAYLLSREKNKALLAYEEAAKVNPTGEIYAKQGFIYLDEENWIKAEDNLNKSMKKGQNKNPEKILFALAIIKYNQKDLTGALDNLFKARRLAATDKNINQWIEQIKMDQVAMNEAIAQQKSGI